MGVLQALEHVQLVVHHPLVALDILLQDDLDSHLAFWTVGLSDYAVRACAECSPEAIFGPEYRRSGESIVMTSDRRANVLLIVTFGLAVQPVEHI